MMWSSMRDIWGLSRKTPREGMPQRMASGFTLLEIMVALGILAIVLTAVLRMHSQTLFVDRQAKFNTIAVLLAQEELAKIEGGIPAVESGVFEKEFSGYSWQILVEDVASNLSEHSRWRLKKIDILIRNPDEDQFALRTYRYLLP